jgi:hypothetical protein
MALSQTQQARISYKREQLNKALEAVEVVESGGQSYTIGDITYTRGNISALYNRINTLEKDIDRLTGARPVSMGVRFGRMHG